MTTDEEQQELKDRVDGALEEYRDVTMSFIQSMNDDDAPLVVEALYRALCHELGHVEGMAVLTGATKVSRDKVRQLGRRQGMEEALEHHDEGPCDGCEGSNELRSELFAN
jgi:hypothetical protein